MTPLDPLTLPLRGSRLIEASAGTGKTWTIAALMVRLVLGHGERTGSVVTNDEGEVVDGSAVAVDPSAPPRPLAPGEVLVMTFTRAATRELSERIRSRLLEAARYFRGEPGVEGDAFLHALREAYPESRPDGRPGPRRAAAHRLALAAEAMDDAAVHTIDAWCQRMLREHAFDSAQLFDEQLEPDEAGRRRQAVQDYWRQQVYPLQGAVLDTVLALWPSVDALAAMVQRLLARLDVLPGVPAGVPLGRHVADLMDARAAELAALKAGWVERAAEMRAWLDARVADKAKPFDGRKIQARHYGPWLQALADWAADPQAGSQGDEPELTDSARERLVPEGLLAACKAGASVAIPPVFDAFAELLAAFGQREPAHEPLLRHAAHRIAARLAALKRRAGRFGYADLSERLDAALHGPQGEVLAQRIRQQFPVALVDEFQDTSPLQYRLFERIYRPAENRPDTTLLLIGDPKQSIYGFRGADIYSYLNARATTAPRHHALGTNHRSTVALVGAVNAVFAHAQAERPSGAFALGVTGRWALPFEPVAARGRSERFVQRGADVPALTWACLPGVEPARTLRRALAEHAAAQLVDWLGDPACGWLDVDAAHGANPADPAAPTRRLRPGDVAVLVRDLHEAEAIGHALARRGVNSVYLSDKDSVFASPEAADLLRWLQAVAEPLDSRLARAAYACAAWNLPLAELAAHVHDDALWDRRVALLQRLHGVWQRQGVLAMLRQTLHALALPQRWLATADGPPSTDSVGLRSGERRLTNLLHLGELLQSAAARLEGEASLIRWLAAQVAGGGSGGQAGGGSGLGSAAVVSDAEAQVVRLESDAQLVQIVTVHKSKGLEYPVVMLPFAHGARTPRLGKLDAVEFVDAEGTRSLDFRREAASLASAQAERLREDLRLFYVALTRARHALWLGVGLPKSRAMKAKAPPWSALTWLVAGEAAQPATEPDELVGQILGVTKGQPAMVVRVLDGLPDRRRWHDDRIPPPLRPAQAYRGEFDRRWGIGSFSALVRDLGPVDLAAGLAPVGIDRVQADRLFDEWQPAAAMASDRPVRLARPGAEAPTRHRFPRGAMPGNFLHDQLQWLGEEGFERVDEPALAAALQRRCERAGHGEHAPGVVAWLQALLTTPLPPLGAPLAAIGASLPEMEFWLPAAALPAAALDRICRAHLLPGAPRPVLATRTLRGLLMGFADLVFEHGGRWWVLDYKSNALGVDDDAYTSAAMQAAMLEHRYELQAALYLLALHRLLRQRLGAAYDPARQLGGAVYLFLRGIDGPAAGCVHLAAEPAWLDALDAAIGGANSDTDVDALVVPASRLSGEPMPETDPT